MFARLILNATDNARSLISKLFIEVSAVLVKLL